MAHALSHTIQLGRRPAGAAQAGSARLDLDGSRIAANAGAIALNAVVLLVLLVPVALPPQSPPAIRDPDVTWLRPPIEPKPIEVPVVRTPKVPKPSAIAQPRIAPPQVARPVVDSQPGDLVMPPADPVIDADPSDTIDPVPPAAASTGLQAVSAPPPAYPVEAIRRGLTGTVELEILVDTDGKPLDARVVRSSGHRVLDQAARNVVLSRWRFEPALRDGRAVQALGRVPIVFSLER